MYVVIMGAGRVGLSLARLLIKEDYDITLIEKDENLCELAALELDALIMHGSGSDSDLLEEINIKDADYFIAASGNDESNLLACVLVNNYDVPKIIARASTNTNEAAFKKVGISHVINPEQAATNLLKNLITRPDVENLINLNEEDSEIINLTITNPKIVGTKIKDVSPGDNYIIIGRYENNNLIIPQNNDILKENEELSIFLKKEYYEKVVKIFEK